VELDALEEVVIQVDVVMRSDYQRKFGGDVAQVRRYRDNLPSDIDLTVRAAGPHLMLRENAIVHIVNIDREWDFLETMSQAGRRQVIVTSIHHDRRAVRRIRTARQRSLRGLAELVLPEPTFALVTRVYRDRAWPRADNLNPFAYVHSPTLRHQVADALGRAAVVHVLARGEQRAIESDYATSLRRVVVIPNGVESAAELQRVRDIPVLVPGRIETRKNQLALARAMDRAEQSALFVGPRNPNDRGYVRRFAELSAESPWITWIPGLPPEDMPALYQRAKVVVNLSHVEVLSLVDLEAYASGCVLITTTEGHTKEWLGNGATYVRPTETALAVSLASNALADWSPSQPSDQTLQTLNWARVTLELARVYRSVAALSVP
jgi:glycosyltransferase involved in cell wall biosynthesis